MKVLRQYISSGFFATFLMTLMVVTFVMSIGIVFKVTDLLAKGVSWRPIVSIFLYGLPQAFSLAIPVSTLTASLLMFGRLSSDGEITAMKANGISMWKIVSGPAFIATMLSILCIALNSNVVPECHYLRRATQSQLGVGNPLEFIDVGRFIEEFPGLSIYIEKRDGETLQNLRVYDSRSPDSTREIRADTGSVRLEESNRVVVVEMRDVRVIEAPRGGDPITVYSERWPLRLALPSKKGTYKRKTKDYTVFQLLDRIKHLPEIYDHLPPEEILPMKSKLRVEVHKRLALSVACFAFAILGIPLGVRANRKESSIGIGLSLILVFNFYIFLILADSLDKHYEIHPHLFNWIPVVLSLIIGALLIRRLE